MLLFQSSKTTGIDGFAECLKHSAKPEKHSAKTLPSVALGKEGSTHSTSAKPSLPSTFSRALNKDFAECQTILGKEKPSSRRRGDGDDVFAEWHLGQHSAKNPSAGPRVKFFAECFIWHSAKRASLPSARATTLSKEPILVPRSWFFAECYGPDTRQRTSLPSVTLDKVTSTHHFYLFYIFPPNKQKKFHRYHIYTSHIITDINIQHKH
jgi:hypothetical protein